MSHTLPLRIGLEGPAPRALFEGVRLRFLPRDTPAMLMVDDREKKPTADWLERWTDGCKRSVIAEWADGNFVFYAKDTIVKVRLPSRTADISAMQRDLSTLPFTVASFGPLFSEWQETADYVGPSFAEMHWPHGWACAFRGEGHARLVSRHWLDFGPWRLVRGSDDVSFVQFHDVGAPADVALEQARPGHERMGISDEGGYLEPRYEYSHELGGLYVPEEKQLRIVVHGRDVSQSEMRDACAARLYQPLGPSQPIASVAYVFMEEAVARRHLHELWLRELECRAIVDGREVRLDRDYEAEPQRPAWVGALG